MLGGSSWRLDAWTSPLGKIPSNSGCGRHTKHSIHYSPVLVFRISPGLQLRFELKIHRGGIKQESRLPGLDLEV